MEKYIKNFPAEKAVVLKDQITCRQGEVVSKTLAQNDAVSVTLLPLMQAKKYPPTNQRAMHL